MKLQLAELQNRATAIGAISSRGARGGRGRAGHSRGGAFISAGTPRRLTLDNRPTSVVLVNVPSATASDESTVRGALLRFGGVIRAIDMPNIVGGDITVHYATRVDAEKAMTAFVAADAPFTMHWSGTTSNTNNNAANTSTSAQESASTTTTTDMTGGDEEVVFHISGTNTSDQQAEGEVTYEDDDDEQQTEKSWRR